MEGAGKLIDDEELREAMREKGLGTPATRAQIIEGLLAEKYIYRDGRELVPTAKAFSLMTLLHGLERARALLAGAHRRMGIQARADGARQAQARRLHARDRRDDAAHRRPGQGLRERHDPRRFRHADRALPEVRRRSPRELQEVPVPIVRLRLLEDHGRATARRHRGRHAAARAQGRTARGLPQPAGPPVHRVDQAHRRERGHVRFR